MRAYIGCFGSGMGHASRMLEVADELARRGALVEFSSSGEVALFIETRGYPCNRLPLADVRYSDEGVFQVYDTLFDSGSILWKTYRQVVSELASMGRFGPNVVLSDSALSTVLAAKIRRLPVFTVLNQLNLTSSRTSKRPAPRLLAVGTSAGMGKFWELSNEVLLPDLPPPYTISEHNLWGSKVGKTRYVGFLPSSGSAEPDQASVAIQSDPRPKVFWQVSGPPVTRAAFLDAALESSASLAGRYAFIITAGSPGGDPRPVQVPGGWFYEWCEIADHYFRTCDAVISRAGHGTIGQAITSSKPTILVPIPKQPEQEGNAAKAAKLGISLVLDQDILTPRAVGSALDSLLGGDFGRRVARLATFAKDFDARKEIVSTAERAVSQGLRGRR
jgi:UDP-N-acetylglucosamine--N-acetylmuramyl-(pentapeptide) pyrophosphoryl-undecaprenol N-acetylglucosamine transferase